MSSVRARPVRAAVPAAPNLRRPALLLLAILVLLACAALPRPTLSRAAEGGDVPRLALLSLDGSPLRPALEIRDPATGRWIGVCRQDLSEAREPQRLMRAAYRPGLLRPVACQDRDSVSCALLEGQPWGKAVPSREVLTLLRRCHRMA